MVKIVEEAWQKVSQQLPSTTLSSCEVDLRAATSLLVLAAMKKQADQNFRSKQSMEHMLRQADVNGDGQLSLSEWYNWLGKGQGRERDSLSPLPSPPDPLLQTLTSVLGQAASSLQVTSRFSSDRDSLVASFISGGLLSGEVDLDISQTLLDRSTPAARELISLAMTLEAASFHEPSSRGRRREARERTVDLSAVPVLEAPPIRDDSAPSPSSLSLDNTDQVMTLTRVSDVERALDGPDRARDALLALASMWEDIAQFRGSLKDLDDHRAAQLRQVLLVQSQGRRDVLGLALSLRISRLQHSRTLAPRVRQRLALETLQLWSPLSYQVDLAAHTPELEIHSYVLLFPRSFGSFLGWFSAFRPLAKLILGQFRADLERLLRTDPLMPRVASTVTLQSRLKTPSSAFKKMVRGAKSRHEMHDFVGLRVIVTPRGADPSYDQEIAGVFRAVSILRGGIRGWRVDEKRLKDYVSQPKASGYESVHVTLVHEQTGVTMEVQVRSTRMHWTAEHGPASHNNYKALLLPSGPASTQS